VTAEPGPAVEFRAASFHDLSPAALYGMLRVRVDVFVVEQQAAYPELDGRDTEPGTVHWRAERGGEVLACLRVLAEPGGVARIGRVCTAKSARGLGLARRLMEHAVAAAGEQPIVLHAQAYLEGWYERFGFRRSGPDYTEDGILHVPMRREPVRAGG
jgi:ElaA protein